MREGEPTKLNVVSTPTKDPHQFSIQSDWLNANGKWDDIYISFSGFFGNIGPHVFAAAPDYKEARGSLFDAIKHGDQAHRDWLREAIDRHFAAADAKAKGQS